VSRLHRSHANLDKGLAPRLANLAARAFAADRADVSANAKAFLLAAVMQSGSEIRDSLDVEPFEGPERPDAYGVVGWTLRGRAALPEITDLLYVISRGRRLARIGALSLVPGPTGRTFDFSLQYEALALVHTADEALPFPPADAPAPVVDLDTPERRDYDVIAARNIFQPLDATPRKPVTSTAPKPTAPAAKPTTIAAEPAETPPAKPTRPPAAEPAETTPRQGADLTLVSGMQFGRRTTLTVRDGRTKRTKTYSSGDRLAGGTVVMLDYRRLLLTAKPLKYSSSRAILLIDREYWAVELGQKFSLMRRLTTDQLPPKLRKP